eukprot:CAMPEP_0183344688 /NCGR_PEP_ID=MMETSP0164_2-20130417/10300_1 /TAXON_ID=221442 /ORGANISM="Coccolithus pelagicus ssp braarudi, Strain PLY182g" /LENGTH=59 /DNA_ID=CAMNT_0025515723 /DNA_START=111 /DNA_END=287 /DNA_ORIENTATION=-
MSNPVGFCTGTASGGAATLVSVIQAAQRLLQATDRSEQGYIGSAGHQLLCLWQPQGHPH